jgi:hypothetical protein
MTGGKGVEARWIPVPINTGFSTFAGMVGVKERGIAQVAIILYPV